MNKKENPQTPLPKWHKTKMRARLASGALNAMGVTYTVYELVQEMECTSCEKTIEAGSHVTRRGAGKYLPICQECCPFEEFDPWKDKEANA